MVFKKKLLEAALICEFCSAVLFCGIENSLFATLKMEVTEFVFDLKVLNPEIKGVLKDNSIPMVICTLTAIIIHHTHY